MDPQKLILDLETAGKSAGLSVADLCQRVPVDRATWQRWKAGRTKPSFDAMRGLSELQRDLTGQAA